jgi:hypothetical protein
MKYLYFAMALLLMLKTDLYSQDVSIQIKEVIINLGKAEYGKENYESKFSILCKEKNISIKYLIDELAPVKSIWKITPESYNRHINANHIIWCIRALRYLTSLEFVSTTKYKFSKSEKVRKDFLNITTDNEYSFFRVRMAHDVTYISPIDVQVNIINKWKSWYNANKDNMKLNTNNDFNDWYF